MAMETLVKKGLITEEVLTTAIKREKNSAMARKILIDEILKVGKELMGEEFKPVEVIKEFCADNDILFIEEITDIEFNSDKMTSEKYKRYYDYGALPIKYKGTNYFLTKCGFDTIQNIKTKAMNLYGQKIPIAMTKTSGITQLLDKYIRPETLYAMSNDAMQSITETRQIGRDVIDLNNADTSQIQQLYNTTVIEALREEASDIHFLPNRDGTTAVKFKIDGKVVTIAQYKIPTSRLCNVITMNANMGETNTLKCREGKIACTNNGRTIELRVNIIPSLEGPDIALRILSDSATPLDKLGMSEDTLKKYKKALSYTKGLVLIVGPMGCGKSTTMYSGIVTKRDEGRDICAIENPVEVRISGITQVDVSQYVSFPEAQQAFLRHNADIQVVGELRDEITAQTATRAANTGTLVLASLHTNTAISTIPRLRDLGINDAMLAEVLAAVISQRLVRKVCPHCSKEYDLPLDSELRQIFTLGSEPLRFKKAVGCTMCNGRGYKGRTLVQECIFFSKASRELILQGEPASRIMKQVELEGFIPITADALDKAKAGITTLEEILPIWEDII